MGPVGPDRSGPVEDDLSALSGEHGLKGLLEIGHGKLVGDHGGGIQAGADHGTHLVPGLEHFATIDAFQDEPLEDDLVKVDLKLVGKDTKEGDTSTMRGVFQNVGQSGRVSGHFESDVESLLHVEFLLHISQRLLIDINGAGSPQLPGEIEAEGIGIGHHHVAGAGEPADRGCHAADGPGAGNENIFGDEIPGEGGVNRIAGRIGDGGAAASA